MRAQLAPIDNGSPLELAKDMTLVGRSEGCDVRLEHKSVSKMHCILVKTDGLILLRDLGSTNGTRVNNQRVRRAALLPNDLLSIASLKFRILFGPKFIPDVSPEERTQQIDAADLEDLLKNKMAQMEDSEVPIEPVHTNPLPDVYDDEKGEEEEEKKK